jgi:hypothetical protein
MRQTRFVLVAFLVSGILAAVPSARAASVSLAWDANKETDIGGYVVSYGTAPGTYTTSMDVGLVTTFQVNNLAGATKYYLSVRAYNRARQLSGYSGEIAATTPGNQPPTLQNPGTQRSAAGASASVQLVGKDPESTALKYAASGLPPGLQVNASTGLIAGTLPTTRLRKSYRVVATATDAAGASAAQSFDWYVGKNTLLNSSAATLSDMNGDGRDDVFLYDDVTGDWSLSLSKADKFVRSQGRWAAGWQVAVARLNDDAANDLFLYNELTGVWVKALSDGLGGFELVSGTTQAGFTIVDGDFDGDGLSDALFYSAADGRWALVPGFRFGEPGSTSGQWAAGFAIGVLRLNTDGWDDALLYNNETGAYAVALSDGLGGWHVVGGQWAPGYDVFPANFNGDGAQDLLFYNPATGAWVQALTVGEGTFSYTSGTWSPGADVRTGDFNGDKRDDSVLYDKWTGAWGVCVSAPSGEPQCRTGMWFPGWELSVGDFNSDGIKDLLFRRVGSEGWYGFQLQGGREAPQSVK